jgi:hypothetical protein
VRPTEGDRPIDEEETVRVGVEERETERVDGGVIPVDETEVLVRGWVGVDDLEIGVGFETGAEARDLTGVEERLGTVRVVVIGADGLGPVRDGTRFVGVEGRELNEAVLVLRAVVLLMLLLLRWTDERVTELLLTGRVVVMLLFPFSEGCIVLESCQGKVIVIILARDVKN